MDIICKHFETDPCSCRFYLFELDEKGNRTGNRSKVHVDGDCDCEAVAKEFKEKHGLDVPIDEIKKAWEVAAPK